MLRQIETGGWLLEVDKERTAAAYQDIPLISKCGCTYCLNFVTAYSHFPPTIITFFEQFGIDPRREGEVYTIRDNGDPVYTYVGFYHFAGRILQAPAPTPGSPEPTFTVFENFGVSFNTRNDLIPKDFPEPAVQMEFLGLELPWMFDLPGNELYFKIHPEKRPPKNLVRIDLLLS